MVRRVAFSLLVFASCVLQGQEPVAPEVATAVPETSDSLCGDQNGRTAIAQLPPVRIVVFDPLSNSFAFVAPCADLQRRSTNDENRRRAAINADYLDRHRLALPTQKIRLLIMPYNPLDGDLALEVSSGQGIEFEPIPSQFTAPPRTTPAVAPATAPPVTAPPAKPAADEPKVAEALEKDVAKQEQNRVREQVQKNETPTPPPAPQPGDQEASDYTLKLLGRVEELIDIYRRDVAIPADTIQHVITDTGCIGEHLADISVNISQAIARDTSFTLATDTTLSQVLAEAARRSRVIAEGQRFVEPCIEKNSYGVGVDEDLSVLRNALDKASAEVARAEAILRRLAESFALLATRTQPPLLTATVRVPDAQWRAQLVNYQRTVASLEQYHQALVSRLTTARTEVGKVPAAYRELLRAMNTPAAHVQRFNFPPLPNGESVTFTIRRGSATGGAIPARSNSLELRSAPAATIRFGAGLVASWLSNPTFKAGPERDEVVDNKPTGNKLKTILFDDESDGQVLPGVFVHHYWNRRSPLLLPTNFERFTPTFSLGIPLAKSEVFEQILLGLDWELVPGVELNVGLHFGKVAALADDYRVNQEILSTIDITTITQKRFDRSVYAGIVLNTESFNTLLGNRK